MKLKKVRLESYIKKIRKEIYRIKKKIFLILIFNLLFLFIYKCEKNNYKFFISSICFKVTFIVLLSLFCIDTKTFGSKTFLHDKNIVLGMVSNKNV